MAQQTSEPVVEYKRRPSTINLLEARMDRAATRARTMLRNLEKAMYAVGYHRDGHYFVKGAPKTNTKGKKSDRAFWVTSLRWKVEQGRGRLLFRRRGMQDPCGIDKMDARALLFAAENLRNLLDTLEQNTRHMADALIQAVDTVQAMINRIEADPRPTAGPPVEAEAE